MADAEYETMGTVRAEVDGVVREGKFRMMGGSVIVYFGDNIKYALYRLDRPETLARWLLSDLCRREELTKWKRGGPR